jgi:Tfp pilus assembly protein PilO
MGIRTDRLWLIGGLFAVLVIVAATYLLAIKPVDTKKAEYQGQVEDSETTLISLKRDLAKRQAQYNDRAKYTEALNTMRGHLPESYDIPNFVRAVQASGIAVSVVVSGISVGQPSKVANSETVASIPITLTASGTAVNIGKFLRRLQTVQSRAVLIQSVNLSQGADASKQPATVLLEAFCTKNAKTCVLVS